MIGSRVRTCRRLKKRKNALSSSGLSRSKIFRAVIVISPMRAPEDSRISSDKEQAAASPDASASTAAGSISATSSRTLPARAPSLRDSVRNLTTDCYPQDCFQLLSLQAIDARPALRSGAAPILKGGDDAGQCSSAQRRASKYA